MVDGEGADAGRYAIELARRGYTALTFDFAGWGDGGGELRHVGSPASKIADIGAAACLSSRSFVAPGGVAHVGICTSGRYALAAVAAGAPIRSFAAVVGWFHDTSTVARSTAGRTGVEERLRRAHAAIERLVASGEVVTVAAYARGHDRAGMFLELDYYADPARGAVPSWPNIMAEMSWREWLTFDGLAPADRVSTPVLFVHSDACVFPDTVRGPVAWAAPSRWRGATARKPTSTSSHNSSASRSRPSTATSSPRCRSTRRFARDHGEMGCCRREHLVVPYPRRPRRVRRPGRAHERGLHRLHVAVQRGARPCRTPIMSTSDDDSASEQMFLTALTTEHFGLQAAASTTVSEASSRASLYMFTLSSSLVAMGFSARTDAFVPLLATVVPVVVVLGVFTVVRLVDTGVQNGQVLAGIARIRAHYRTLSPEGAEFFPEVGGDVPAAGLAVMGLRRRRLLALFTAASMVSAINSVVAGVGVALWVTRLAPRPVAIGAGALVGALFAVAFLVYQDRRYRELDERPAPAEELTGPDSVTAASGAAG